MFTLIDTLYTIVSILLTPIVLILILSILTFFIAKKKSIKLIIALIIIILYGCSSGLITKPLLNNLQTYKPVTNKIIDSNDAIILLGAGVDNNDYGITPTLLADSRILETIRIYNVAKKHNVEYKIIVSGGDVKAYGKSEAEVYAKILEKSGIPAKDIILENKSLNTYQNAGYTKEIIKDLPYDKYLLVTSGIHMKRSLLYFKSFSINVIPASSDDPKPLLWIPISYNLTLMDFAIHEYFSIGRFYLYNYLNMNSSQIFDKSGQ